MRRTICGILLCVAAVVGLLGGRPVNGRVPCVAVAQPPRVAEMRADRRELPGPPVAPRGIEEPPEEELEQLACGWCGARQIRVVDAVSGGPIEGARATVLLFESRREEMRDATTDFRGNVELQGAFARSVALLVRKRGYVAHFAWLKHGNLPYLVELTPGTPVHGRVVLADGSPAAAALVYAWDEKSGEEIVHDTVDPYFDDFAVASAEGEFEIDGVAAGRPFILCVLLPGYGVHWAVHRAQPEIRVRLGDGAAVEGRVFDAEGNVLANADVFVEPEQADGDYRFGLVGTCGANARTVTDADGRFRIVGVPVPGRYVVTASMDYWARGASAPIELRVANEWQWRDVSVEASASLVVRVAGEQGNPWIRCDLRHLDGSSSWSRFWSNSSLISDGTYSRDGIHAGTYLLRVKIDHRLVDSRVVDLRPGEKLELEVGGDAATPGR